MTPGILQQLMAANNQEPQWGPNPYPQKGYGVPGKQMAMGGQGPSLQERMSAEMGSGNPLNQMMAQHSQAAMSQQPPPLEQMPSDLWGQGAPQEEGAWNGPTQVMEQSPPEQYTPEQYAPEQGPQITEVPGGADPWATQDPRQDDPNYGALQAAGDPSMDRIDLTDPTLTGDPGAMESRMSSIQSSPPWPDDSYYYDRNEGDMGVMLGQDENTFNVGTPVMGGFQPGEFVPGDAFGPMQGPQQQGMPPQAQGGPLEQMFRSPATGGRMTSR